MGEIVINKKNTTIDLFNYKPFRSVTKAEFSRTLMSDDYVDISVECANTLDLNIGDRVTVEGRTFFLNMLPPAKKIAEDQFTYELRFEGPAFLLRKLKVFNLDSQGNKTTNEFPLTGEINEFLYLLINNANKKDNQWILGNFPTNTETKTLTFNNENCLAVLQRICQEFKVEFDIVEAGGKFVLNIREKIGKLLPFTVEYGMGNGLYDLSRTRANDSEVVTVLYAYGSSQNIPVDYRGYSPRLRMPVSVGDYIANQAAIDLFGYVEDVFTPEIKPTFKGVVSNVGSLANQLQSLIVSNMDFDLKEKKADGSNKYLIAGTPAKISVTKGDLAGYDFEVVDYIHATKTFKLKQFADDKGQKFPDDTTVFKFASGDEFTLIDIMMPEQYIVNAEQKLYDETVKEYQKVSQNNVKYTLNVDPLFLQDKGEIGIGDLLPIKDADFGIDKASRIISLKKDLLTDTYTSFDVADSYEISLVKEIVNNIKDLQKEIASQKVINRQSYLDGYRRVEDRFSMYFDADGKMDGSHIKADTIDVGMLSSGSKSRWFQLEEVVFTPNLGSDPNSFRATAGRLVHFGIKTSAGGERVWNLSALTVNNLLNQGYYVYAKCDINGDYGTFIITPDRIVFDSQPNYYHFLIGNLYTATSGGRAFDANYGVSQMNGRMIFAGVISDIQGRPMIDLDKREIIGKVTFTNDSPALGQVQVNIDQSKTESISASKSYSDAQDNLAKIAAAAYADGIVDAEEARAIADATLKMEAEKSHAQNLVNNIPICCRNTFKKSTPIDPLNVDFQRENTDTPNGFYAVGRNNPDINNIRLWGVITGNGEWTVSFEMRGSQSVVVGLAVDICDVGLQYFSSTADNSWKKFSLTVNVTNYSADVYNFVDFSQLQWAYYLVRNIKVEKGNKATDWTPAPEDIDDRIKQNEQQTALAKAQADNALATSNTTSQKVSFLSTTINNNVVATGTLEVGDVVGANAGITGVTDRGRQSVRLYAGSTYAGKNTAPWYVDDYGVEYQYLNGVMIRRRGVINGSYVDELYNISGQLAKKTAIVSGKILEEWYNNGQLVYQIGENGIYFVREIPESYTEYRMLKLIDGIGSNPTSQEKDDLADFIINRTCGVNPIPGTGKFDRYNIYGDRSLFLYNAGQNVNSQSNKQYEGYKNSQNKYDNAPDGWYVNETLGWGFPGDVFLIEIIYLSSGAQIKNIAIQRDVSGRIFMECSF
nr:MAG TPA: tail protein [Caudoviricetes sp.]